MLIIKKYLTKEILATFAITLTVMFFIYGSNQFIDLFNQVANGKLTFLMVFKLILLFLPEFVGSLIPISLYISNLLVFSKLYSDNEIVVFFNTGLGINFFITFTLVVTIILSILNGIITLWITPSMINIRELFLSNGHQPLLNSIIPGRFNIFNDGRNIIYVGSIDPQNNLRQIFMYNLVQGDDLGVDVITANSGNIITSSHNPEAIIKLSNGNKYLGKLNKTDFWVIQFGEYTKQLFFKNSREQNLNKSRSSLDLVKSKDPIDIAELEWRIALPFSNLILSIFAVAFAKVAPRQGRFANFLPAILLYITYSNIMLLVRRLVGAKQIAVFGWGGVWCVHLGFLAIAIIMLLKLNGRNLCCRQFFKSRQIS